MTLAFLYGMVGGALVYFAIMNLRATLIDMLEGRPAPRIPRVLDVAWNLLRIYSPRFKAWTDRRAEK